jgi:glucokinase
MAIVPPTPARPWLVADIGGTNARFGLIKTAGAGPCHIGKVPSAEHRTLASAATAYLAGLPSPVQPTAACVAVAGPVTGDRFKLTNQAWDFSIADTKAALGLDHLALVNDFEALALSLPHLTALRQIGPGEKIPTAAMAVVGPGTGLGVGAIIPDGSGHWVPVPGEGGHCDAPIVTQEEAAVAAVLRAEQAAVTAECFLSGGGIERLYRSLATVRGFQVDPHRNNAAITATAMDGSEPLAVDTLSMFCALLGSLAGNLAVTFGARGGVFIGGGIVPRFADFFAASPFRARFEARYRMAAYAHAIPTYLILADTPALDGAAAWLNAHQERVHGS